MPMLHKGVGRGMKKLTKNIARRKTALEQRSGFISKATFGQLSKNTVFYFFSDTDDMSSIH